MSTKKTIVVTGPTVEEAIKKGLAQLDVGPSQVIVEVLDEPVRGLFGIGARQARVRLQSLVAETPEPSSPVVPDEPSVVQDTVGPVTEVEVSVEPKATAPDVPADEEAPLVEAEPPVAEVEEDEVAVEQAASETYDDDDFFDDDGNFSEEVEVLDRGPKVTVQSQPSYFRRLSFVQPELEDDADPSEKEPASDDMVASKSAPQEPEPTSVAADFPPEKTPDVVVEAASDEVDDDEVAEEVPIVNLDRRGPARFENFERRGRRYNDDDDDDDDDEDRAGDETAQDEAADVAPVQADNEYADDNDEEDTFVDVPSTFEPAEDRILAEQKLSAMMDIMALDMVVEVSEGKREDDDSPQTWILNLRGDEEMGAALVGTDGETLSALQFLTRLMVSKQTGDRANIIVDVNEHRLQRTDRLADLANRMADEAIASGRKVKLEPMPSHERRIVHMVLRRRGDVKTDSVGRGDKRCVTIAPKTSDETD